MPTYDGDKPLLGHQAMVDSIVLLTAKFWILLVEPRYALLFLAPLGSFAVLFVPFIAMALREDSWPASLPPLALSVAMWFLPAEIYQHTLYGFWVWNLSALLLCIAVLLHAITLGIYDRQVSRDFRIHRVDPNDILDPFEVRST